MSDMAQWMVGSNGLMNDKDKWEWWQISDLTSPPYEIFACPHANWVLISLIWNMHFLTNLCWLYKEKKVFVLLLVTHVTFSYDVKRTRCQISFTLYSNIVLVCCIYSCKTKFVWSSTHRREKCVAIYTKVQTILSLIFGNELIFFFLSPQDTPFYRNIVCVNFRVLWRYLFLLNILWATISTHTLAKSISFLVLALESALGWRKARFKATSNQAHPRS